MKNIVLVAFMSLFFHPALVCQKKEITITPMPMVVTQQAGEFIFNPQTVITTTGTSNDTLQSVANFFSRKLHQSTGYPFALGKAKNNVITLRLNAALKTGNEEYTLNVTPTKIEIEAKTPQGIFYAMQSLLQLMPPQIESPTVVGGIRWAAPAVLVKDSPRFGYRGIMIDVCRHFYSVDFIKKQLDVMAMLKINRFHWHLTDDHLWAIEIKKYPELTAKGANRQNAANSAGDIENGFYTQEQIKEVVSYAAERFITVIPEIELPGHAQAALSAFPELSCAGGSYTPRTIWGVEDDVYCVGNEKTFQFLTDVIEEVISLFPGKYFHIGGDECPKVRWEKCPKCQKRMKDENLKNEHELQSYIVKRIGNLLLKHGKAMIGWDEILEGGLAPSATVMSWRGEEGGIEAAKMGHDVIMTPGSHLYIDKGQGGVEVEPIAIGYPLMLSNVYGYEPASEKIPANKRHHVLGAQGNLWTEYIAHPNHLEYMLYPRAIAIAEMTWTSVDRKNYDSFLQRLPAQQLRLEARSVNYHIPIPEGPLSNNVTFINAVILPFNNSLGWPMVYTLDGTTPSTSSQRYSTPLTFDKNTVVKIATIAPTGRMGTVRTLEINHQSLIPALQVETKPGIQKFHVEGDYFRISDLNWANWGTPEIIPTFLKPNGYSDSLLDDKGAWMFMGYLEVPADGVYYIGAETDLVEIAGRVVVTNDGKIARHFSGRGFIALQKGKHPFRVLTINNNYGGYLRVWNNVGFRISDVKGKLIPLTNEQLSHR